MQYTLSIIKPDAMKRNLQAAILKMIEDAGLKSLVQKTIHLTAEQAQAFYAVHKDRPFYKQLWESMIECPVSVQVLYAEDAIKKYRDLMGATNPSDASEGTIRKEHGLSIGENSVHGSDSEKNAEYEIAQMFSATELIEAALKIKLQ